MVCTGNICRSPYAERLLVHRLDQRGAGRRFTVGSAGMRALAGRPMHEWMATELSRRGGSAEGASARQGMERMLLGADLVLTAARDVRSRALAEAPGALRRTFTVLEFAALVGFEDAAAMTPAALVRACATGRSRLAEIEYDVPDPINQQVEAFASAALELDVAVTTIADALVATREDR